MIILELKILKKYNRKISKHKKKPSIFNCGFFINQMLEIIILVMFLKVYPKKKN